MGLLRSLARGVGSRISPALWGAGIGAGLGGSVSAMGSASDQMLANLPPDQQQAAVRRAYELSQQQQ